MLVLIVRYSNLRTALSDGGPMKRYKNVNEKLKFIPSPTERVYTLTLLIF
jgi:hypothetical protein